MKYSVIDTFKDRIEEIDKQLKGYIFTKQWDKVKLLRMEKKELLLKINALEAKHSEQL
jgi:hypothetical protein